jgi:hypothetical protein
MIDTGSIPSSGAHPSVSFSAGEDFHIGSEEERMLLSQVDRVLCSEVLRGSEALRRLLRFLAEKSVCGGADELKEYIVAIDGLGKPASYDPSHNSAVRIQVGRLRQKLADYYRTEGQHDPILVDVPKGHFKLKFEYRDGIALPHGVALGESLTHATYAPRKTFRKVIAGMRYPASLAAGVLLALAASAVYNALKPAEAKAAAIAYTADMEDLWRPFIASNRPMIVAIEDPLFVELDGKKGLYYRDQTLNNWHDVATSSAIEALRNALKSPELAPSRYYTTFGEADSSFLLARVLGSRVKNISVVKTSNLSMRELGDNNVVFVGIQNVFFTDQIQAAPVEVPSLQPVHEGIRNVHPGPNEPAIFLNEYSTAPTEEGIAYALVTHVPGPLGGNDIESFTSSRAAGYVAAVRAFTDPPFVHMLVRNLKQVGGNQMPRYYQVLLKVKFTDEEPTEITFVQANELHYQGR